jgi:hypothetical protein
MRRSKFTRMSHNSRVSLAFESRAPLMSTCRLLRVAGSGPMLFGSTSECRTCSAPSRLSACQTRSCTQQASDDWVQRASRSVESDVPNESHYPIPRVGPRRGQHSARGEHVDGRGARVQRKAGSIVRWRCAKAPPSCTLPKPRPAARCGLRTCLLDIFVPSTRRLTALLTSQACGGEQAGPPALLGANLSASSATTQTIRASSSRRCVQSCCTRFHCRCALGTRRGLPRAVGFMGRASLAKEEHRKSRPEALSD